MPRLTCQSEWTIQFPVLASTSVHRCEETARLVVAHIAEGQAFSVHRFGLNRMPRLAMTGGVLWATTSSVSGLSITASREVSSPRLELIRKSAPPTFA